MDIYTYYSVSEYRITIILDVYVLSNSVYSLGNMKVLKTKQTVRYTVILCSGLIVILLIFHMHSSQYVISLERNIFTHPFGNIPSANMDVNTLKSDVNTLKSGVNTDKSDVDNHKSDVDTLKTDINTGKSDVDTHISDVNTFKADVDTHISDVNTLKADVDTNKSDVNTDKSDVNTHISDVNTHISDINTNKSDVNAIRSELKRIISEINMIRSDGNINTDVNNSYPVKEEIKASIPINRTIFSDPPIGTLLSRRQIAAIKKVLPAYGNLLVWGLGNDSPFWHHSTKGRVIFIEHEGIWLKKIMSRYPFLRTYRVNYTTLLFETFDKYINHSEIWSDLDLRSQLPPFVKRTPWNVILVDAPQGYGASNPGRYQSIYTSSLLAQSGTHVFVDDFERKVEREYSLKMLGDPVELVNREDGMNTTSGNQVAHFYHIHSKQ